MEDNKKLVFVTFFPDLDNNILTKDVGMIPNTLQKNHGYSSYIMCFKTGEYPRLKTETTNLRLCFMKKNKLHDLFDRYLFNKNKENIVLILIDLLFTLIDSLPIMMKYAKKIDVLQLYHLKYESMIIGYLYKRMNPKGKLYLKMDMNPLIIDQYSGNSDELMKKFQLFYNLGPFDIISIESRELREFLLKYHPLFKGKGDKLYYIPNGLDMAKLSQFSRPFTIKENIILHVARMGIYEKGSEIILEAFQNIARDYPGWKLVLIGAMENDFKKYFTNFLIKNQDISKRIDYRGFLENRDLLFEYYSRAKIIAIPSRSESFCFAAIEGGYFGDIIVGSNLPPLREFTDNGKLGYLCGINDVKCYEKTLRYILTNDNELIDKSSATRELIKKTYDWDIICSELNRIIKKNMCMEF